jgi:DNA-binding transcriptional MerR regulator
MLNTLSDLNKPIFTWRIVLLIMRFDDNIERLHIINQMLDRKLTVAELKQKLAARRKPRKQPSFTKVCGNLNKILERALKEAEKYQQILSLAEKEVTDEIARDRAAILHVTGAALAETLKKQNTLLNDATNEE